MRKDLSYLNVDRRQVLYITKVVLSKEISCDNMNKLPIKRYDIGNYLFNIHKSIKLSMCLFSVSKKEVDGCGNVVTVSY